MNKIKSISVGHKAVFHHNWIETKKNEWMNDKMKEWMKDIH